MFTFPITIVLCLMRELICRSGIEAFAQYSDHADVLRGMAAVGLVFLASGLVLMMFMPTSTQVDLDDSGIRYRSVFEEIFVPWGRVRAYRPTVFGHSTVHVDGSRAMSF